MARVRMKHILEWREVSKLLGKEDRKLFRD
jgi:hypothetical protein